MNVLTQNSPCLGLALALGALLPLGQGGQGGQGAPGGQAAQAAAEAASPEVLAFVELTAPAEELFVHQSIRLTVRMGLEERFLETRAVQPFGTSLELPVQLRLEWLGGLPGLAEIRVETPPSASEGTSEGEAATPSFALNEDLQRARRLADRVIEGRTFQVFAVEAVVRPDSRGQLHLPAPVLAFAYATRFEETLLTRRSPTDRVDAVVSGSPLTLRVRGLPAEGRPLDFTNAVGRFHMTARAEPLELTFGESLRLTLTIEAEGEGNLAQFEPPHWEQLGAFRVQGMLDEATPRARILTLDLRPESERVWQVPAVRWPFFDPGPPGAYRIALTDPIDIVVRPSPAPAASPVAGTTAPTGGAGDAGDAPEDPAVPTPGDGRAPGQLLTLGLALAFVVLALVVLGRRRRA